MPSQTLTMTWQQGSEQITIGETYTADTIGPGGDYPIPAGQVNLEIDVVIDKDLYSGSGTGLGTVLLFMVADGALTIKTNSSGAPADTIVTVANKPIILRSGGAWPTTSFSADVTKIFVSNATGGVLNLRLRQLVKLIP